MHTQEKTNYTVYQQCISRIVLMEAISHLYVFLEARWLSRWFHFKEKACKINLLLSAIHKHG